MQKKLPWERSAAQAMAAKKTTTREKHAADAVSAFNAQHDIGTSVRYWPCGRHSPPERQGQILSAAYILHGRPMVRVTGLAGGVALTHVEVTE